MRLDWRAAIATSLAQAGLASLLLAATAVRFGEGGCHLCIGVDPIFQAFDVPRLNAFHVSSPIHAEETSRSLIVSRLSRTCGSVAETAELPRLLSAFELPASAVGSNPLRLCVRVGANGAVERIRIPSPKGFDTASLDAIRSVARRLRFAPALRAGLAVSSEVELTLVAVVPKT